MDKEVVLFNLVREQYRLSNPLLHSLMKVDTDDRGIYQVSSNHHRYVLRACHDENKKVLHEHVAILKFLESIGYPAPKPKASNHGVFVAEYHGWHAILLTYVEGDVNDYSLHALESLGETAGHLHSSTLLNAHLKQQELPDSRLHPNKITTADLEKFERNATQSVAELRPFCELAISTVKRVKESSLPLTLVHGDCWSANAVTQLDGTSMLIDWDFSGIGPAVLELGYLLMACHVDRPQIPKFVPDLDRISAILRGYSRHYKLGPTELSALSDAIAYDPSRRLIRLMLNPELPFTIENWKENGLLSTLISRLSASPQIVEIASSMLRSHNVFR